MKCPKDLGSYVKVGGQKSHSLVAAAASDNAAKETAAINRQGYLSAVVLVPWEAQAITDTKKLSLTVKRYQSANGTSWDAAETIQDATAVFTAATPTLAGNGCLKLAQDLSGCKQYVKYEVTADLDASGTDTACYSVVVVLGGGDVVPAA